MKTSNDRFAKLSDNYGNLFTEVFAAQGLDYSKLQKSIFDIVKNQKPNFENLQILDIGIGDGETSRLFVDANCQHVTGLDLNIDMLQASKKRFGKKVKLVQGDALKMHQFQPRQFSIIITATCIHNIEKNQRQIFWQEIKRLQPDIFVGAEKIADPDIKKHLQYYKNEIGALNKIYGEKYTLPEALQEWLNHYEYDEREKLEITEIINSLGPEYSVEILYEMGMCKTFLAKKIV